MMQKQLLILDLDETLIYATEQPLLKEPNFMASQYFVYKRPFVETFLTYCFENFDVAVWTTATESYAKVIVQNVFGLEQKLQFVWTSDRCTWVFDEDAYERIQVKKLEKLRRKGFRPESIIVVDDSANAWKTSYGNLVRVSRFEGEDSDDELQLLPLFLEKLKNRENVRVIEKRNWRSKIGK